MISLSTIRADNGFVMSEKSPLVSVSGQLEHTCCKVLSLNTPRMFAGEQSQKTSPLILSNWSLTLLQK